MAATDLQAQLVSLDGSTRIVLVEDLCGDQPCAVSDLQLPCLNPKFQSVPRLARLLRARDLPLRRTALHCSVSHPCRLTTSLLPVSADQSRDESHTVRPRRTIGLKSDQTRPMVVSSRRALWMQLPKLWSASGCSNTSAVASPLAWASPRTTGRGRIQMKFQPTSLIAACDTSDGFGLRRTRAQLCGAASSRRADPPCWARLVESVRLILFPGGFPAWH